jgi:NADH dehydrogenase
VILVTGGAGVMGSRLVQGLATAGHRVRVLTLPDDPNVTRLADADCEVAYGDVSDATSLAGVFDGVETVYHLAAVIIADDPRVFERVNAGGTRNMVAGAAAAGVRHFVYVSSISVLHPEASAYARSKAEGERIVQAQREMQTTIVRPTLVYGPNEGQEFMMFMDSLKRFPVVPFVGRGDGKKRPVHVDDMVRGLLAIAGNEKTHGKTYDFSGGEAVSIRELARLMLAHQGLSKPFVSVPVPLCRFVAWVLEHTRKNPPLTSYAISRIVQDAAPPNDAAREDLGYDPIGVRAGLAACYPLGPATA